MICRRSFLGLILLFAALTAWAVAEPAPVELAQRRKLEALRKQPEQLARLRQDLHAFLALPEERRQQLIQLDEQLHQETSRTQARLWHVLERYADWLERLPEQDRQRIKQARDKTARLALIRALRDQEWMLSQPKAYRDQWARLEGDARKEYVKDLRTADRQQRQQWQITANFWKDITAAKKPLPSRLSDFSQGVQRYVGEYLMMTLSDAERQRLGRAEGRWPDYPQTLVDIACKHPSALPPPNRELPRHLSQLPVPIQHRITDKKLADKKGIVGKSKLLLKLQPFDGSPNFASKVVELGTKEGKIPFEFEFWACNFKSLQPAMQMFVEKKLTPKLTDDADKAKLLAYEGKWPYYPQAIQELSQKYHLHPPWHILPEAKEWKWDLYRPCKQTTIRAPVLAEDHHAREP